ncbi:MAG: CmcI family methyltransferase [Candidatus Competibacteraceae bacterium]|jgi:cephalosporin hydroxylase
MTSYMEENLDTPLREVLAIMQDRIMNQTTYWGVKALKNPLDHWIYQELIYQNQPDIIIEIGNANGGSTLSLAHICELLGQGKVIGIDISHEGIPDLVKNHYRITLIEGDACQCFSDVAKLISAKDRVLIIEDSSHTYQNTLNILRTYSALLKPGDYFIVEDSICHHGLSVGPKPGPYEAIEAFTKENADFAIDRSKESFLITWNPKGYLKRINLSENISAQH